MGIHARKTYFISDLHLGADTRAYTSKERELIVCDWLASLEDGSEVFFLGDIFDYWFEYGSVVPRGYSDLLAGLKLAMRRGISIVFFSGNHDMWMKDFFQEEYGIPVYHDPIVIERAGKRLLIGHGDGLGPGDLGYKRIKKLFRSRWAQKLYYLLHPDLALPLMKRISQRSEDKVSHPYNRSSEMLIQYCNYKIKEADYDYFVFGHRHLVINHVLENARSRYINIGDWMEYFSYGVLEKGEVHIRFFKEKHTICE